MHRNLGCALIRADGHRRSAYACAIRSLRMSMSELAGKRSSKMAKQGRKAENIRLPNTLETWTQVCEVLKTISEGKVRSVEDFEDVYPKLFTTSKRYGHPKFASLRRVLKDAEYVSESHFLDTLLPWMARKALEVEELFKSQDHKLRVSIDNL